MKKYLFITDTEFGKGGMTGAHRRFIELVDSISETNPVTLVSYPITQLEGKQNIRHIVLTEEKNRRLPDHIAGTIVLYKALRAHKKELDYDYAVSFGPSNTICYGLVGIKNVVTLFREDPIGYLEALQVSPKKLAYYRLQEQLAVKFSDKIIVQCKNDCANLVDRNKRHCKNVTNKVFIQINNVNASWMNTEAIRRDEFSDISKILFIGNFSDRRKGHGLLLPAAARLLDEGFRFELWLAGDGTELDACKANYAAYPAIQFLGRVSNMPHYLQQTDFEIVPSLIDSCPNTVLEGLNAEIAVYGANTGGIPDLLQDPEYLFEPNADAIYEFLKNILKTKRYINDAKAQNVRKQELTFDWGKKIQSVIER